MCIHMGMRATEIQYSINVRTPKKWFFRCPKNYYFLARSKSRTVSPFPQQTTRCPRTPQEIVWHTKPTRVRPVPPSPPLPNGSQPISRVDARTTEEVQVFLVAHQDGYRKLSDVNFISYAMIKISKCGGIYTMAIDR